MAVNQEVKVIISADNKTKGPMNEVGAGFDKLKSSAGGLLKVVGVAAVGAFGAMGVAMKQTFDAFVESEKQMAVANKALENTLRSLSASQLENVNGYITVDGALESLQATMDDVGKAAVKLAFDDEDASVAFAKLFQTTKDVVKSQDELALAMDLAAFSGRDLESATQAVLQVHAGGTRVLKEFGIEVQEGTTVEQALAMAHERVAGSA